MSGTLLKREIKASYKMLLIFLAVLAMYAAMIVAMYDPKLGESLNMMAASMPEIFAAFGMLNVGSTLLEFVSNYLYGFLLVVFPLVFIIMLANRLVARYVDRGSMAYLLATPVSRARLIFTQVFVLLAQVLFMVLFVVGLIIGLCEAMFAGQLEMQSFLLLNAGLLGLLVFLAGINFFTSCVFNDTRSSYSVGAGLCIAFVLVQMVSQVGDKFAFLKYATPLTLFDAAGLCSGSMEALIGMGMLYLGGLLLLGLGMVIFCKKDMPV